MRKPQKRHTNYPGDNKALRPTPSMDISENYALPSPQSTDQNHLSSNTEHY